MVLGKHASIVLKFGRVTAEAENQAYQQQHTHPSAFVPEPAWILFLKMCSMY